MSKIHKFDMARIVCGEGYVTLLIEDCSDGVINLTISEANADQVRIGIPSDGGMEYRFWTRIKEQLQQREDQIVPRNV